MSSGIASPSTSKTIEYLDRGTCEAVIAYVPSVDAPQELANLLLALGTALMLPKLTPRHVHW